MTWFDDLRDRVEREGQRPHVLAAGEGGGRLLVTEHGARVLACELPGVEENLFFDTSALPGMKVTGGDRLWIAPEAAFFWPSLADARRDPKGTAEVPDLIDPADYRNMTEADEASTTLVLCQHESLDKKGLIKNRRGGGRLNLRRDRTFTYRLATGTRNTDALVTCSFGIAQELVCMEEGSYPGRVAGTWDILQIPVGGTLICPTTIDVSGSDRYTAGDRSHAVGQGAGPRSYYEPFGDRHVSVEGDCVRFLVDGKRRTKMGLLPEHTTGRMGYYRVLGDGRSSLIFRAFAALPGEPYCDLPVDHPAHDAAAAGEDHPEMFCGDALQAYNDDGDAFPGTSFGEMEYHDPCVVAGRGPTSRSGSCVTHVMAGPDEAVRAVGRELLGVEVRGIG